MSSLAVTTNPRQLPPGLGYLLAVPASNDPGPGRYWPSDVLYAFTLKMAAHGLCVSASMMLGDRQYALEQLQLAHTMDDAELREIAMRMFGYFEQPVPSEAAAPAMSLN
jgi:hypothetical protein